MGTTVQKLQRILETKTGFKNLITEKGGVITETTTFHEYIDEARKLMEGGKVVVEEISAMAVPNSGVVENIYFNTSLTPEEVDKIITDANLEWQTDPSSRVLAYGVYYADSGDTLIIMKFGEENPKYIMMGALPSVGVTVFMPYLSIGAASLLGMTIPSGSEEGWIHDPGLGIPLDGIMSIKGNLMSEYNGMATGIDNEALKKLISSTPFSGGGKQPVPNSGYVNTIKFNTSLTPEEVDKIITEANLSYINAYGMTMYPVFMDVDTKAYIAVVDATSVLNTGTPAYQIVNLGTEELLYSTPELTSLGASVSGWNSNFNGAMEIKAEAHSDIAAYATQNDKLIDLFYISSEPFRKELSGTYEAVTTDITENGEVDLTTYWDNQQMPIKVNVNIKAGASGEAIEVATEEELDAAMVEENLGKFYKYTGESTNKYEKDAVYVVQDADNPIIEDEIKSIATETEMDAALVEENIGKFFLYAGETCDKYINNMIYTVQDKDNPIIDGPAIIEGGATGTAVPNEGLIDKIYFNTNLSIEEVDNIINNANLDWVENQGIKAYGLVYIPDWTNGDGFKHPLSIALMQMPSELAIHYGYDKPINIIFLSEGFNDGPIFASEANEELSTEFKGWGIFKSDDPDNYNIHHSNPLEVGYNAAIQGATNTGFELSFGTCNEELKQIFSTTPFDGESFRKELKGTYEPVTVEVTENSEVDLTSYMDEQKMPIKVNINIDIPESEATTTYIPVPTEGYIEKVYLNKSMSADDVDALLETTFANYDWEAVNGNYAVIYNNSNGEKGIAVSSVAGRGSKDFIIADASSESFIYISPAIALEYEFPVSGWNPDYPDLYEFNTEATVDKWGPTQKYNDKLKEIFYIDKIENKPATVKAEETRSAVPNSGYLDTVYFNTDLTVAEIDEIIANADIPWNYNGVGEVIFVTEDTSLNILLLKGEAYELTGYMIVNMQTMEFLYVSQDLYNIAPGDCPFVGWNPLYVDGYMVKANILSEITDSSESLKIGENNEALKNIIYVKSGFNYDKQLAGNYEAVNINITNNQKIELDSYFDNKQVPVKLNVNVASSGSLKALLDHTKSTSYLFSNWTDVTEYTSDHIAFDATSNVEDMSYMFKECEKLVSVPLFDTSNAINLERIFWGCLSLAEIPEFNLSNAANLEYAFYNCTSLKSIPELNTSNAISLQGMFQKCTALKEAILLHLEKATNISYLFRYCDNLEKVVLGDLSPMMEADSMFGGCYNLTNLTIGSIWFTINLISCDKLTLDSLIGICKACVCRYDNNWLKINTTSLEKLANVYVKFTNPSVTEIPIGEKGDVVVCDSTDEGAMLITDYMALKNWAIQTS